MRLSSMVFVLGLLGSVGAHAAERTFALMSIAGSELAVVRQRATVGSNVQGNAYDRFPVSDARFDHAALDAAEGVIAARGANARTLRLAAGDAKWVAATRESLVDGATPEPLVAPIVKAAQPAGATHLLLIAPARAELRFRFVESHAGSGRAEGIGLYADRDLRMRSGAADEVTRGFLGLFAHLRLMLVDLGTGRVVGDRIGIATATHPVADSTAADPLSVLTPAQQAAGLERLIARVVADELPSLLSAVN